MHRHDAPAPSGLRPPPSGQSRCTGIIRSIQCVLLIKHAVASYSKAILFMGTFSEWPQFLLGLPQSEHYNYSCFPPSTSLFSFPFVLLLVRLGTLAFASLVFHCSSWASHLLDSFLVCRDSQVDTWLSNCSRLAFACATLLESSRLRLQGRRISRWFPRCSLGDALKSISVRGLLTLRG